MTQAQLLVLNSFYLRFSSLVLHFHGPISLLSVKFLPSKVLLSLCLLQSDTELAVYEVRLVCKFLSALYYTVTLWASTQAEQPLAAAVRTCQPSTHTVLFTSVLSIYLTTDQKKLPFYKVWHSHLVCIENHYIIFSTVPTKGMAIALLLYSLTTDRTLIKLTGPLSN